MKNAIGGSSRDYAIDNIRFFLIFFVVFGHFIELASFSLGNDFVYKIIYVFHMPLFLFQRGKYNICGKFRCLH
jgi:fucose 4-O-acetylase-like acetyltransferase